MKWTTPRYIPELERYGRTYFVSHGTPGPCAGAVVRLHSPPPSEALPSQFLPIPIDNMKFEESTSSGDGKEPRESSEIQLALVGEFEHPWYGNFEISKAHLRQMQKNFREGDREIVIDFQHSSTSPDPEEAIAAGWVDGDCGLKIRNKGTELWCKVNWTANAAEKIREEEYKYISPEIAFNYIEPKTSEEIGCTLMAAALTNRPFLTGMAPVELSEGEPFVAGSLLFTEKGGGTPYRTPQAQQGPSGQTNTAAGGPDMEDARIRQVLGLAEDVAITDEHRTQALAKLNEAFDAQQTGAGGGDPPSTPPATPPETPETPGASADPLPEGVAATTPEGGVVLTQAGFAQMQADISTGAQAAVQLREMRIDVLLKEATGKKIFPAEVASLKTVALRDGGEVWLKEYLVAKPTLDSGLFRETGSGDGSGEAPGQTEEQIALQDFREHEDQYRAMGITEADIKEHSHLVVTGEHTGQNGTPTPPAPPAPPA